MKTLLNQKKQTHSPNPSVPNLKTQNRITSAYYTSKIVKGKSFKQQYQGLPLTMQYRNVQQTKPLLSQPLQYPFFSQPKPEQVIEQSQKYTIQQDIGTKFNETQHSKQTQMDGEIEVEVRPQTSPETKKIRQVKDFKELMQKVAFQPKQKISFVLQNRHPDFIHNVDEFSINQNVHKHLQKLKQSNLQNYQRMPRNQSSKLERQRDLIEKTITARPIQSQQIKRRQVQNISSAYKRPKTTAAPRKPNNLSNNLESQWMMLAQKAQELNNQVIVAEEKEEKKELTHLDVETNYLSQEEREFIKKKRNYYLDDIRPYIEQIQSKAEQKKQIEKQNLILDGKHDKHNSLLSELEFDDKFIQDDQDSFEVLEDDIQVCEYPLNPINNFFSRADPINKSFTEQLKEVQNKFDEMDKQDKKQYQEELQKLENEPAAFLKVGEQFTSDEMTLILKELKKQQDDRNYELLDGFCKTLKFFWQFSKQTRILLLQLSSLQFYKAGEYIFMEGEVGDQMYIILNGACHVRIKNPHIQNTSPIVSTLYNGQQFGELALIDPNTKISRPETNLLSNQKYTLKKIREEMSKQEQNQEKKKNWWKSDYQEKVEEEQVKIQPKRSASIECAIDTYLLAISRDYFKSIILNVITSELEDKLKTLMAMPCFEFLSQMELIPIANLLENKTYKLGEVILKEGEEQKFFYIVASGRCKGVKEEVFIRDLKTLGDINPIKKKPLKTGLIDYAQVKIDTKLRVKNHQLDLEEVEDKEVAQSFPYQEVYRNEDYMAFKYHFHYLNFVRGDFFMGRVLLNEYKLFDEDIMEMKIDLAEPSKLTIISDAAKTEIYRLDKGLFHLIAQPLKQHLIDGIKRKQEFDEIFDNEEATRVKKWDSYKMNLFKGIMDQKQLRKMIT